MKNGHLHFPHNMGTPSRLRTIRTIGIWVLSLLGFIVPSLVEAIPRCYIYADTCLNNSIQNTGAPLRSWFVDQYPYTADANQCQQRAWAYAQWCGNDRTFVNYLGARDPSSGLASPSLGRVASSFGDRPPSNDRIFPQPPNVDLATPLQDPYSSAGQYLTDAAGLAVYSAPDGCQVEMSSCRYPGATRPTDIAWYDDWDGSRITPQRCMARANEYAAWCKQAPIPPAPKPLVVRARYWAVGTVQSEVTVQDAPPPPATSVCITRTDGTRTQVDNVPIMRGSRSQSDAPAVLVERGAMFTATRDGQMVFVELGASANVYGNHHRLYVAGGAAAAINGGSGTLAWVKNGGRLYCSSVNAAAPVVEYGARADRCNAAPVPVQRTATFERCDASVPWSVTKTVVNDTAQTDCYENQAAPSKCPAAGMPFAGQDAQKGSNQLSLRDNGDGTISDLRTGLMWAKTLGARLPWDAALAGASTYRLGGYNDWRLPNIKELYSLIQFNGVIDARDPTRPGLSKPFIDTSKFEFAYVAPGSALRFFDNQYWSSTKYIATTSGGENSVFGVNFSDGRIKSYPIIERQNNLPNTQFVRYVRGKPGYGTNSFADLGNGTVIDYSTNLMWQKSDSGSAPIDWKNALAYCENLNFAGHTDWRLPNAKELQSIVDYTRSPATSRTPAINPVFAYSNGEPYYWTSTTLAEVNPVTTTGEAIYIAFGRAIGYLSVPPGSPPQAYDVHGAGAQRSDPKEGRAILAPPGRGPQGDDVRIRNFARCVRGAAG
jgi:Protein of unknown function (DUF1566)